MSMDATPTAQASPKRSKIGCILLAIFGAFLLCILICAGVIGGGVFGLFAMIKSSEPYEESLRRAQQSVEVQDALGTPIEAGTLVTGNINLSNDDGEADLSFSISGPDGSAAVFVEGTKSDGQWDYDRMEVKVESTGESINLRE